MLPLLDFVGIDYLDVTVSYVTLDLPAPDDVNTRVTPLWRLHPDNFTPPARTPWGGTKIIDRYKRGLALGNTFPCVGEAWEVSVEPSFPSRLSELGNITLAEQIAKNPGAALGVAVARRFGGLPILVKLLDAKDALSVQVHPRDDYPGLTPKQSGKPESWIILEAEAGAGLYLGFKDGVTKADVAKALREEAALDRMMNFVAVKPGDVFEIEAGTPHAIGGGCTLVEPQLVQPGREGVTYRFWDWNRRYDGKPRPLHVDDSLAVTRFDLSGDRFVESTRRPGTRIADGWVRHIDTNDYRADVLNGSHAVDLASERGTAIVVARGTLETPYGRLRAGESAFLAPTDECRSRTEDAFVVLTSPQA